MTTDRRYIRTESPTELTEPLTVTLVGHALSSFNAYRQSRHAWLACTGELGERARLHRQMQQAAADLAGFIGGAAQHQLGEPSDYADEEESD
jgi:hypothetical protein